MSEREGGAESAGAAGGPGGAGFGGFLLGLAVGAAIGFLFAPEAGSGSRRRLTGKSCVTSRPTRPDSWASWWMRRARTPRRCPRRGRR